MNMVTIMNGSVLECYPKDDQETSKTRWPYLSRVEKEELQLFLDNAFFLLDHYDQIMNDSRMFLAEIPVRNGLDGVGDFRQACLGAYLEWWQHCPSAVEAGNGCKSLVFKIKGKPLSCSNNCEMVMEDGSVRTGTLNDYMSNVGKFCYIFAKYMDAMDTCQAYTIKEVLEQLHRTNKAQKA